MKHETKHWVKRGVLRGAASFTGEDCADILDSDARQAAELRRLRAAIRQIDGLTKPQPLAQLPRNTMHIVWAVEAVVAALKPARRKP